MYTEIIEKCNSNKNGYYIKEKGFKETWPKIYEELLNITFDHEIEESPFKVKLWHFLHGFKEIPTKECGNKLNFKNFNVGYSNFCSKNCECSIKHSNEMRKSTSMKKYGVSSPTKLKEIRNKISLTKRSYTDEKKSEIEKKKKETYFEKYGVDNPNKNPDILNKRIDSFKKNINKWKESYKNTSLHRYGTEHPFKNDKIKDKVKNTLIEKYGVDNPLKSNEIKDKIKNYNQIKYGVDCFFKTSEFKERFKEIMIKKYGVDNPSKLLEIKVKISKGVKDAKKRYILNKYPNVISILDCDLLVKCESNCKCGGEYLIFKNLYFQRIKFNINPCIIKNPIKNNRILEQSVESFLNELGLEFKNNDRLVLNGSEIDFLFNKRNFGIEFNGLYWHSEIHKNSDYHHIKSLDSLNKGIQLFHIWEDDWRYKEDIIKSMIKSKLGILPTKIGARKCKIIEVSSNVAKEFLENNHLQGNVNSKVRIGLFYNDKLVSIITLGKKRKAFNQNHVEGEWELYRFATKLNTNVIGGFSKMLNYFIQRYNPNKIITYASLDHSNGEVYFKNGFSLLNITKPGYFWIINGVKMHRFNYSKHKLVSRGENPELSESDIMHGKGYYRLWDSGNLKFEMNLNKI